MKSLYLLFLLAPALAFADERLECQLAIAEEVFKKVDVVTPEGEVSELNVGQAIQPGDLVRTDLGAWVDLRLCDGSGLRVGENSKFYYEGVDRERESFVSWAFRLVRGTLLAAVVGDGQGDRVKLRIRTPSASMGVRGTEFVVDAEDDGDAQTALHTLEGEVLIGAEADFDKMGSLHGTELLQEFEPVAKEKMSQIRRKEAKPLRAAAFKTWEFRAERRALFERTLRKKSWPELRDHFRATHERLKAFKKDRGLFRRTREKLEERVAEPSASPRAPGKRQEKALERIQENLSSEERRDHRQEELSRSLEENKTRAKDKREKKGWRKNLQGLPRSPRF